MHIVRPVKKNGNRKRENELTYSKHLLFAGCFTHLEVSAKTRWLPLASYAIAISTGQVRKHICPRRSCKGLAPGYLSPHISLEFFKITAHIFFSDGVFKLNAHKYASAHSQHNTPKSFIVYKKKKIAFTWISCTGHSNHDPLSLGNLRFGVSSHLCKTTKLVS